MKRKSIAIILAVWSVAGCEGRFPRDPLGTAEKVRGGTLRVGLVENTPWVVKENGQPGGIEGDLVRALVKELQATPEWHWGGEQSHMEALERFELDLVVGGITKQTPWKKTVGLTAPYFEKHVWVTAPGENAWIKSLDEFLSPRRNEIQRAAEEQQTK